MLLLSFKLPYVPPGDWIIWPEYTAHELQTWDQNIYLLTLAPMNFPQPTPEVLLEQSL